MSSHEKQRLETTIAICGHAKHGKSTLAGRILLELGGITQDELERKWLKAPETIPEFSRFSKDFNKYNLLFLERNPEIRDSVGQISNPSRTAVPARASLALEDRRLTIIDEPGYSRFIGNLVYGIYMADLAVLVVEAKAGVARGTELVARLLSQFRIPIIAVCVTKMDEIGFSEKEFHEYEAQIAERLSLLEVGPSVPVLPIHALSGEALDAPKEMNWYRGPGLIELIKGARGKQAVGDIPEVRFATKEALSPPGAGTVLVGVLETGSLNVNDQLVLEPASSLAKRDITFKVRSLQRARGLNEAPRLNESRIAARAIVSIATGEIAGDEARRLLRHGGMLGTLEHRPSVAIRIRAQIVFFRSATVYAGKLFTLHTNSARTNATIESIMEKRGVPTNLDAEEYDLTDGEIVKATLAFTKQVCIECEERFGRLTRFVLRQDNEVIACGMCVEVLRP